MLQVPAIWTVPLSFATMIILSILTPRALHADVMGKLRALHLPEGVLRRPGIAER
jgi:hypothetical protein